jgi:hypothetical protein
MTEDTNNTTSLREQLKEIMHQNGMGADLHTIVKEAAEEGKNNVVIVLNGKWYNKEDEINDWCKYNDIDYEFLHGNYDEFTGKVYDSDKSYDSVKLSWR